MYAQQKKLIIKSTIVIILILLTGIIIRASATVMGLLSMGTVFEVTKIEAYRREPIVEGVNKYVKGVVPKDVDLEDDAVARQILLEGARFGFTETQYPNPYPGVPIVHVYLSLYTEGKIYSPGTEEVTGRLDKGQGEKIGWGYYRSHAKRRKEAVEREERERKFLEEQKK